MWSSRLVFFRLRCLHTTRRRFSHRSFSSGGHHNGGKNTIKSTGQSDGGNWGRALWATYLKELQQRPIATKMWTSGVINALGDILAQHLFEDSPFNRKRLFVFTNIGLFLVGPTLHIWYGALNRLLATPGLRTALGSLMLDQFAFAPCFCAVILGTLVVAETGKMRSVKPKLQQDLMPTVVVNWKIWIPAQLVNFWVVPPPLRVLFANIVALIWTTYLSYASHKRVQ